MEEEVITLLGDARFGVLHQITVLGMLVGEVVTTFLTHARVGDVQ